MSNILFFNNIEDLESPMQNQKIDINEIDTFGRTDLHWSVYRNDIIRVQYLLKTDIDIDHQDNSGDTAIHLAIENKNYYMVLLLTEYGANLNLKNNTDTSILERICTTGYRNNELYERNKIVDFLISHERKELLEEDLKELKDEFPDKYYKYKREQNKTINKITLPSDIIWNISKFYL